MNTKITAESKSVIVRDQSDESIREAMQLLGYTGYTEDPNLKFYRRAGGGNQIEARAVVEPTDEPLTPKNKLIETQDIERDYGFKGTRAIVDTLKHGRLLIEDGYGGVDSMGGGCVRWKHGSAYQLQPGDTFESLQTDSEWEDCGQTMTKLGAILWQVDDSRPYLHWDGHAIASLAGSLGLN